MLLITLGVILVIAPRALAAEDGFSATVVEFQGDVSVLKTGEEAWFPIENDIPLEQGDKIKTGDQSTLEILLDDGSLLKLEENSEVTLSEISVEPKKKKITSRISLWFGRLLANVRKFTHQESKFEIRSRTVVAAVRGTEFIFEATDAENLDVAVFSGEVAVAGMDPNGVSIKESEQLIKNGYQTAVRKGEIPLAPFLHTNRMASFRSSFDILQKKAIERRRILNRIIEKRRHAQRRFLDKYKSLRKRNLEKRKRRSAPGIQQQKLDRLRKLQRNLPQRRVPDPSNSN